MDLLKFLDLSGLEEGEVEQINGLLFRDYNPANGYPVLTLPFIVKSASPQSNEAGNKYTQTAEPYTNPSDAMNYPTQMTFIPIPFDQTRSLYNAFLPRSYRHHHPPVYTNYHHPTPPMMGSNENQIHYVYPTNQVYNYAQVPVSYENHQQHNIRYVSPPIANHGNEETQVYSNVSNGDITYYHNENFSVPQECSVPTVPPTSTYVEPSVAQTTHYVQAAEEIPATVSVPASPIAIETEKNECCSVKQNGTDDSTTANSPAPVVNGADSSLTTDVNRPTRKVNGPALNANAPAFNAKSSASIANAPAPNVDAPTSNNSDAAPKPRSPVPKANTPPPKTNGRSPNSNGRSPKPNDASPKTIDASHKPNDASPKTNDTSPKTNGRSPKTNGPVPNDNEPAPSAWGKKSWVSLFQKETTATNGKPEFNNISNLTVRKPKENLIDPMTYRLGEIITKYKLDGRSNNLQPRGLINRSNYCYINSILQALLACSPFCNLLMDISKNLKGAGEVKSIPMIENMCKLMDEFEVLRATSPKGRSNKKNKRPSNINLNCGNPFEANWFYTMLNGTRSDSFLVEGRQEDAEEFLGLLLNGLNDEMISVRKLMGNEESSSVHESHQDSDDWKVMGPKNKGNITRKFQFDKTPISDIFGGLLCSKIHKTGDETTVNIQPFFTLQLNIEKADTIMEALENFTNKNQLEGLTCSKTKKAVEAWQQVMIEQLPAVLVLHLKCFDYKMNGCTKIMKTLDFPIDLKVDSKILSGRMNSSMEKQYKLFAVVYHEGKEASKGHYIADAFHTGYNCWLRYDDSKIRPVLEEHVLSPQGFRVPYLLFYRRSDTSKGV